MSSVVDNSPRAFRVCLLSGLAVLAAGMGGAWLLLRAGLGTDTEIDLSERIAGGPAEPAPRQTLRMAVVTTFGPRPTYVHHARMVELIGRRVGLASTLVIRPTYREIREALLRRSLDVAIVCTGPYVLMQGTGEVELLVQPELLSPLGYHCAVIVPAASSATSMRDLRGGRFAYSDPESHTGCFVARHRLRSLGQDPDSFFGKTLFTGSHDRSVLAVVSGLAEGAAVHSLVLEAVLQEDPGLADQLRIIWRSERFGPPPVVVPSSSDPVLKAQLRGAFLAFHQTEEGRAILDGLGVARYEDPRPADYAGVIEMYRQAGVVAAPTRPGKP